MFSKSNKKAFFCLSLFLSGMKKIWPNADSWLQACNIKEDPQHGGSLNGNGCRKLLRNTDKLASLCGLDCLPFVRAFKAFEKVVKSCFSLNLDIDYKTHIEHFREMYSDLGISITPKVHTVFFHVHEFCDRHQTGLGIFSEQASEAVHSNFSVTWKNYKFSDIHPEYPSQLLRAVNDYNTSHLL